MAVLPILEAESSAPMSAVYRMRAFVAATFRSENAFDVSDDYEKPL